ncbi:hypothetical protein EBT31_21505 [bacterium]|nr:hypothetical protein [bacterium]
MPAFTYEAIVPGGGRTRGSLEAKGLGKLLKAVASRSLFWLLDRSQLLLNKLLVGVFNQLLLRDVVRGLDPKSPAIRCA